MSEKILLQQSEEGGGGVWCLNAFNLAGVAVMTLAVLYYWVWSEKEGTDWMFYDTSTSWKIEEEKKGAGAPEAHSQTKGGVPIIKMEIKMVFAIRRPTPPP